MKNIFVASRMNRVSKCPGSYKRGLEAPAPLSLKPSATAGGLLAHKLIHHCLEEDTQALQVLDSVCTQEGVKHADFDKTITDSVQCFLDYIDQSIEDCEEKPQQWWVGYKADYPALGGEASIQSSADFVCYYAKSQRLHIYLYKHSASEALEIHQSPEVLACLVGITFEGPVPISGIKTVTCTLGQPKAYHPISEIRDWETTPLDLMGPLSDLEVSIKHALAEEPTLVPGQSQCRRCPALALCPAAESTMVASLTEDGDVLSDIKEDTLPEVTKLSAERLAYIVSMAPAVEAFLKSAKDQALVLANAGVSIAGFKLVAPTARRKWDPEMSREELSEKLSALSNGKVPPDAFVRESLLPIGESETILSQFARRVAKGKVGRDKAVREMKDAVAFLAPKPKVDPDARVLVPVSDRRPPVGASLTQYYEQVSVNPLTSGE